jgi:hypothetical protein
VLCAGAGQGSVKQLASSASQINCSHFLITLNQSLQPRHYSNTTKENVPNRHSPRTTNNRAR